MKTPLSAFLAFSALGLLPIAANDVVTSSGQPPQEATLLQNNDVNGPVKASDTTPAPSTSSASTVTSTETPAKKTVNKKATATALRRHLRHQPEAQSSNVSRVTKPYHPSEHAPDVWAAESNKFQ